MPVYKAKVDKGENRGTRAHMKSTRKDAKMRKYKEGAHKQGEGGHKTQASYKDWNFLGKLTRVATTDITYILHPY